jgi:hypothetical protein
MHTELNPTAIQYRIDEIQQLLQSMPDGPADEIAPNLVAEQRGLRTTLLEVQRLEEAREEGRIAARAAVERKLAESAASFRDSAIQELAELDLLVEAICLQSEAAIRVLNGYSAVSSAASQAGLRAAPLAALVGVEPGHLHALNVAAAALRGLRPSTPDSPAKAASFLEKVKGALRKAAR